MLGKSYRLLGLYGLAPTGEMMPRARAAVERALSIDPNQVEAIATLEGERETALQLATWPSFSADARFPGARPPKL